MTNIARAMTDRTNNQPDNSKLITRQQRQPDKINYHAQKLL